MNKLKIEAIRALPADYVRDGTQVEECCFNGNKVVVAMHTDLPPIAYYANRPEWAKIIFTVSP